MTASVTAVFVAVLMLSSVVGASVGNNTTLETVKCGIHTSFDQTYKSPTKAENAKLVVDIKWAVTHDEDSGDTAFWALDQYSTTLYVWNMSVGSSYSYFFVQTFSGTFHSPAGAISPGNNADPEANGISGKLSGALNGTITGYALNPAAGKVSGYLGTINYGGTTADVLSHTQTGNSNKVPSWWVTTYFGEPYPGVVGYGLPATAFGFVYHANNPNVNIESNWCDSSIAPGTAGDILAS